MKESAAEITRKAKSNLAFALACLPREQRADLVTFYAFCRIIDDIADDSGRSPEERQSALDAWKSALSGSPDDGPHLAAEVRVLRERHGIDPELLLEIIRGCESDLHPQRFKSWEDLKIYNFRVACAVGLSSLPIFGATDAARGYALALGNALQLTNILRDVGEDLANGSRIYLPTDDLARFHYSEQDLQAQVHDERFVALMEFQAGRAETLFHEARSLLPAAERRALRAPEIMRRIYHALLLRMRKDQFHVFTRRYKIPKPLKISMMLQEIFLGTFGNS